MSESVRSSFPGVVVEGYHKLVPGVKVHAVEAGDEKAIQALREEEEQ